MSKPGPKPKDKPAPPDTNGRPKCPKSLPHALRAKWREMTEMLDEAGILGVTDADALELYCVLHARWQEAEAKVREQGGVVVTPSGFTRPNPWLRIATDTLKDVKALLLEFGLTPVSRQRVAAREKDEVPDKWKAFE